jgi:3-dehydroquinate synthase
MAELIKTAFLEEDGEMLALLRNGGELFAGQQGGTGPEAAALLTELIARAMEVKGRIVEADPRETGTRRALLNLGHTFGHALEAAAGLGALSHGEAVAWGMVRAAELGRAKGVTPEARAEELAAILSFWGYETRSPHPLVTGGHAFFAALERDKKKKAGKSVFIVPTAGSAEMIAVDLTESGEKKLIERIVFGI